MDELRGMLQDRGVSLVGFADLSAVDEATRRGHPRAVSMGLALTPSIIAGIARGPTDAYRKEYDRTNAWLSETALRAAEFLSAKGWRAEHRPATGDWNPQTLKAPFFHKMAATLSGLGWIGRCDLLVTPEFGSAVRWSTVLTDAPLATGKPQTESRCGNCHACVDVCPGKACSGKEWRQGMPREDFWDARACMAGMKKINQELGTTYGICGMCIAACPLTTAYLKKSCRL